MKASKNIRRKLFPLIGAAFLASPFATPQPASALTYVNLLTGETYSSSSEARQDLPPVPAPDAPEPMPPGTPQPMGDVTLNNTSTAYLAGAMQQFAQYRDYLLNARSAAENSTGQQVAQLDRDIHEAYVTRQLALSTWHARRTQESVQRYHGAQARIEQLQTTRLNLLTQLYAGNIAVLNDLKSRDPAGAAGQYVYDRAIAHFQNLDYQVRTQAQADFGLHRR